MKKLTFTFSLIMIALINYGQVLQSYENRQWCFGQYAGLDFVNLTDGKPTTFTSSINQIEGVASISDKKGNLLFYTNGVHVWDSDNVKMKESGTSDDAILHGHASSTQSAIIIPFRYDSKKYYIFTVDAQSKLRGLRYSIVDISTNEVLQPLNISVAGCGNATEKLTAILHADGDKYWVIAHDDGSNDFYVSLLDDYGIITTTTYSIGSTYSGYGTVGYMKFSHDKNTLAVVRSEGFSSNSVELFRFNNHTGAITNFFGGSTVLGLTDPTNYTYGLEFSSNNRFLYVTEYGMKKIYQYDLTGTSISEIQNSVEIILTPTKPFALLLAPDNLIYYAKRDENSLGTILLPDSKYVGQESFIDDSYVILSSGSNSMEGLPNFINTYYLAGYPVSNNDVSEDYFQSSHNQLKLYPNPSNGIINIRYCGPDIENGRIVIQSISGKIIHEFKTEFNLGKQVFNLSDLEQGYYFLSLMEGPHKKLTNPFVKL